MLSRIFRFELSYHARQPLVYVVSAVLFLINFGATASDNITIGGLISTININAPFNVILALATTSMITSLIAGVAFASNPVLRDFDQNVAELFFTTRVSKFDYLFGRFAGAVVFCFIVYFAASLGILIGEFMPWLDPERLGPTRLDAFWFGTWVIAIPNMLMICSLVFLTATLTRSLMASYAVLVLILVANSVVASLVDPEDIQTLALLDPFGIGAITEITRYWTPFQMNEQVMPLSGNLLYNRMLVLALVALLIAAAYRLFPFSLDFAIGRGKLVTRIARIRLRRPKSATVTPITTAVHARRNFAFTAQLAQLWSLLRIEFHNIVIGKAFLMLAMIGMLQVVLSAYFGLSGLFGTEVYPSTPVLVRLINGAYTIPLVAVMIFYSSELLVRERNVHVAEIIDSMPHPDWVVILAKILGLMAIMAAMLIAVILGGMQVQVLKGFYDFQLMQYLLGLFAFFQFPIWFTCVLAVFAQVLTGNRYLGMFVMVLYFAGTLILPQQGFDQYLYLFATPGISYSDFTGWGPNLSAYLWFSLYWSLFCLLLLFIMHLLWQRGIESGGRFRWRNIRSRLNAPVSFTATVCLFAFIGTGVFIYYNTNVLNEHLTRLDRERLSADYEKAYKQFEDLQFPDLVDFYTEVDLYPQTREAHIEGRYTLQNNYETAISELHFTVPAYLTLRSLNVPDASLRLSDEQLGYYIYSLNSPMRPGTSFDVSFVIDWLTPGFVNDSPTTRLLKSGTFFDNTDAFPLPGYASELQLLDNNRRRRYDLPPVERAADIDDSSRYDKGFGSIRMRSKYEAIVSTSLDQIAVTPGYLEREWEENGRRYFHYRMDQPIWPFVSFLSADYERKQGSWNGVNIEVYYKHDYNVDRMIEASQKSLEYFSTNFSPYPYRQYRIFEFPRQRGTFAQSFPNTIPFSEAIGFNADIRDPRNIDYVFYVTAHELAHQWWGHQVAGADVQGSAVLTETLSQYSALMIMEQEYGAAYMQRFLKYELDNYLSSRGTEVLEEMPLYRVENQGYIHYRKGSLVLYALKDYLGEDTVNGMLRDFIREWGFQGPPYPTTRDLITRFRAVAAPEYQAVITDLFEKIVLFDLRAEDSAYRELDDGRFEVTINTTARKFEADGSGEERPVAMDALIDIAVLGEENNATGIPEVLYIAKQRIYQESQTFKVTVDKRPVSAGIDPFNKLIDRIPDDNVKPVTEED